jgi:regulator of protease activity HflC (stomatin/prohibitin superfamily)
MQIFELISQFFNFIISFLPRYTIIKTTHAAVKFVMGNKVVVLTHENGIKLLNRKFRIVNTGIHIYWPLVSEIIPWPTKRQTTRLEKQILTTKDGKTVIVTGIVVYEVDDVLKLLTNTWDHEDTIKDYATVIIQKSITGNNFDQIKDINFTRPLRSNLRAFGVKVIRVNLCDFATGNPLLHMGIENKTNIINGNTTHE